MFTKLALLAMAALAWLPAAHAQNALPCGATEAMEELARQDPDYARHLAQLYKQNEEVSQNAALRGMQQSAYVIPVVVHIIHDYAASSNISNAQIMDAMRILNEDFNKQNADTAAIASAFKPIHANVQIEFRLARLDPDGNCTDGITRTYSPLTNSGSDAVKNLIRWDPARYFNIWIVRNISSGAGGYSYLPCVSPTIDGVVVRNAQFGSVGTSSPWSLPRSITHEVGHYLGLPHTWGGSNTPGISSNCTTDDGIADTPNTVGVSGMGCNTGMISCGNLNNVQNFMDYSSCQSMFTLGQKAVMLNVLQMSCRNTMWAPANLVATGTSNGYTAAACAPTADFNVPGLKRICQGATISFTDHSYSTSANTWTREWFFPGASPATSTLANPTVTYLTPGLHPVTLVVTSANGSSSITKTEYIQVLSNSSGLAAPVAESFENPAFPAVPSDPVQSWELENSTSFTWERTTTAAFDGSSSMRIRQGYIPAERTNSLVSPNIDLTALADPELTFAVAYAKNTASPGNDRLKVYYSLNCGQTWFSVYNKAADALATAPPVSGAFVPANAGQWRTESVSVPVSDRVMFKFESVSGTGNTMYLDAVSINGAVLGLSEMPAVAYLQVLPNPGTSDAIISYHTRQPGTTHLQLTNTLGQVLYAAARLEQAGEQRRSLRSIAGYLSPGLYLLRVSSENHTLVQKIIIQP